MHRIIKGKFESKIFAWAVFLVLVLFAATSSAQAANVNPSAISGSPGGTVTLNIAIDQAVTNMSGWGVDIYFDTSVLEFSSVDKSGTLSAPLTVGGTVRTFGARIGAYEAAAGPSSGAAGTLLKVLLNVKSNAYKNSTIQLTNFVDYVDGSTTTNSTFTITGVTRSVVVTPASTTNVVAGQPVTLTAEVLINGAHLNLTNAADVTFTKTGNGTFGAASLTAGSNVQVVYTTHTTVETANITATENLTGSSAAGNAVVTSIPGALATLTVSPDTWTLTADDTKQFTVTGVDANNNPVDLGTSVQWTETIPATIGTINPTTGLFTAIIAGMGTVTATSGAISDVSGTITVNPGALATLTVSPDAPTLNADQTQQFTVAGVDADGNAVNLGTTVTWSGGASIGSINAATGLFTANIVGTGTVTATSSLGKSDNSGTIRVTPGAPARMTLTAANTTLASDAKGNTVLTATILDADGNVVTTDNATVVTFTLTDSTYLTLSSATATASAGVATVTLTTKAGNVATPPATSGVNITSAPVLTAPAALTITIVNFSATPVSPALVTVGTPHTTAITAIGAANYTWSKISGNGTLSATTGTMVTLTAPTTITGGTAGDPTVIRVTDAGTPSVFYEMTIRTYAPLQITQPAAAVGITNTGALNNTQLQVTGGSGTYNYAVTDGTADVITVSGTGLVTAVANGVRKVYAWDATNGAQATADSFRAETPNIEVVAPVAVTPATMNLQASKTQQFAATGGKGGYVWTISNAAAGSISATGLFTAAAVTANQTATITATDGTYSTIKGTATVTVFPTLAISNAPATTPTVVSGTKYGTVLQAAGAAGSGNYEWKVTTDPSVTFGDWATADTYTFTAPKNSTSAGVYVITLRDKTNPTFTSTFEIKVAISLDPPSFVFKSGGVAQAFTVSGSDPANTYTWDILSDATMAKVTDITPYGGWTFVQGAATNTFTPATVTAIKTFYIRITVEGNQALIDAGLDKNVFGPFRIIPTGTYTVNLKNAAGAALGTPGEATVTVNYAPAPLDVTTAGKYIFTLPDTGGTYLYNVSLAGYISKAVSSALKTVDVTLQAVDAAKAISGTVTPALAVQATVTAYLPAAPATQYSATTSTVDGSYTINLPTGAAATGWTVIAGKKTGYTDAAPLTGIAAGATAVNFTLAAITGAAPNAGTAGGGLTATANGQTTDVQVPAGGLTTDGFIVIVQDNKNNAASSFTSASPTYIYEIKVQDGTGTNLPAANIKRIVITLPLDLSVVKPGDMESGVFRIYSAANRTDLEAGNVEVVPLANIISADYVGNGAIGSVTFWVDHLSFFGIGIGGSSGGAGTESSSGCFIATAAFGSYFEKHVQILRNFRDVYLLTHDWGRAFVGFYYRHSPAIANVIANNSGLRAAVRLGLMPVVGVAYLTLHTTPLEKVLILVLLIGILTAGMVMILRMKRVRRVIG